MMPRTIRWVVVIPAVLALSALAVGCSSAKAGPAFSRLNAEHVATQLPTHVASVASVLVYTDKTDNEHLLGRPGGYLSKASFTDSRVSDNGKAAFPVDRGGIVEVFRDSEAAAARVKLIQRTVLSGLSEYDYLQGATVLRVSRLLTPEQATQYKTALEEIVR